MIDERAPAFFNQLVSKTSGQQDQVAVVVVFHAVSSALYYLPALQSTAQILAAIPKPGSAQQDILDEVQAMGINVVTTERDLLQDSPELLDALKGSQKQILLVDIGGYFAPLLGRLSDCLGDRLLGVVEDTENGIKKYEELADLPCPVRSVARSPLKRAEDHLVGAAVVHSVEACLRTDSSILNGREACVIGYGKVGRGAAHALRDRRVALQVVETDHKRAIEALADGFLVPDRLDEGLKNASIVISATGSHAMGIDDLALMESGAFLASVTSADDEFKPSAVKLLSDPDAEDLHGGIFRHRIGNRYFHSLHRGNAVNFLHGGALGPFIYLVQAEIVANVATFAAAENAIDDLDDEMRDYIAKAWRKHFTH